jgi:hypothetical protein
MSPPKGVTQNLGFALIPDDMNRKIHDLPPMRDYQPPKLSPRQAAHDWQGRACMLSTVKAETMSWWWK